MPHCVLIVDDNVQLRRIIRVQVEAAGLEVCGEAVDGLDAIEKARDTQTRLDYSGSLYAAHEWH